MKLKLSEKEINKLGSLILNAKTTYFCVIAIIIIQFILVSIIFLQNKKAKYLTEQTNLKVSALEISQNQLTERVNLLQGSIMKISAQIYRLEEKQPKN